MDKSHVTALKRAIEYANGSQVALAARMRNAGHSTVTQQTISYWLKEEVLISAEWWPFIEKATDFTVTRNDLRPDVFVRDHVA